MANPIIESLSSRVSELETSVASVKKKQEALDADLTVLGALLARIEKIAAEMKALAQP